MKKTLLLSAVLIFECAVCAAAPPGYTVNHSFNGTLGDFPLGTLVSDGTTLYGMTYMGGAYDAGTIFSFDTSTSLFLDLLDLPGGLGPNAPLGGPIKVGNLLYGTTKSGGGGDNGVLFSIDPAVPGSLVLTHQFSNGGPTDGKTPAGSVLAVGTRLYGLTTYDSSLANLGTLFSVDPSDSVTSYTIIHWFGILQDGAYPYGSLVSNGTTLYGTTAGGGQYGYGTVFSLKTDGTAYTLVHEFAGGPGDGETPRGALVSDGSTLYGTTYSGSQHSKGTVFSLKADGTGYTIIHAFAGPPADGANPTKDLALSGDTLYGMTWAGGKGTCLQGCGTLFSLKTDGTGYTVLHHFQNDPNDGWSPRGGLVSDGTRLYGLTAYGGTSNNGTIFSFALPTPTPTATPVPNYVNLTANPSSVAQGGSVSMGWSCNFTKWKYQGVPVNVYVAAIKNPKVVNAPSSTADALAGGTVYLAGPKMASWYPFTGSVGEPTWSGVAFPPAPTTGTKSLTVPANPALAGDWVFATAFIRADGTGFVRADLPVENSNIFSIQ